MLGFLPLSSEPLSSILQELIRLESTLDSICIIDPRVLTITPVSSEYTNEANFSSSPVIEINFDSSFSSELQTNASGIIQIPKDLIFINNAEVSLEQLIEIQEAKTLDIISNLSLNNYFDHFLSKDLSLSGDLIEFSKIVFYSNADIINDSELDNNGIIQIPSSSTFAADINFAAEKFINLISLAELNANSSLEIISKFDSYSILNIENVANLDFNLTSALAGATNFEIVGILSSNLSATNRDIVYYILAIDRSKPFELQILRSK